MYIAPPRRFDRESGALRRLERRVFEKPWGRTDLPRAFGDMDGRRIGEIWYIHPDGDAAPFMIKYLFTSERLSIQVHPDDNAARASGLPFGKDECWLVLGAEDGARLGVGLKRDSDAATLRAAALDGSIVDMVEWRAAAKNDFIYNPAGTIHAIGGGLTIVEVQQNVDRTYRLYDYGRPRELHLEEGLAVATPAPVRDARDCRVDPAETRQLVDGPHFEVLHLVGPVDHASIAGVSGELTLLPLSSGCYAAGETVRFGEAVLVDDAALIDIAPGARALLCWAA